MTRPTSRILIRGFGLVTPLAHSAWETFAALLAGRTILSRADRLPPDTAAVDLVRALGCVSFAQYSTTDPAVELAERAAREAMEMSKAQGLPSLGLPIYLGISKGAVHALTAAAGQYLGGLQPILAQRVPITPPKDAHLAVALGPAGYLAHHLAQRLPFSGEIHTTVAACASSLTALHHARLDLLHDPGASAPLASSLRGRGRYALVLTSEAALLPAFIHSYARLGVLPPLTTDASGGYRARPLDQHRQGFVLAELAAAVLLERIAPGSPVPTGSLELLDTAIAADGHDLIRPAPNMPALEHIARRLLTQRDVHLIHPHATGTPGNPDHDEAELAVYHRVLRDHPTAHQTPDFYAAKGALGHGLGSAGLVSLVLACLCAKARQRPPMPWLTHPIASPIPIHPVSRNGADTHAVFAAGFGGHAAGALIARV